MSSVDDRFRAQFAQLSEERRAQREHLPTGGGGGTSGGVTDDWKASVEGQLKTLHDDVRRLTACIIAGSVAPFVALGIFYSFTYGKYDQIGTKFDAVEARIVGVDSRISASQVEQAKQGKDIERLLERIPPK